MTKRTMASLLVVMAMAAAACTGPAAETTAAGSDGGTDTTSSPPADRSDVELTFQNWFYGASFMAKHDVDIANFIAADERVSAINPETVPYPQYFDILNVRLAGGSPPDSGWMHYSQKDAYIDSGALVDLAPIIAEKFPDYELDDFSPALIDPFRRGDALYGIPQNAAVWTLVYNVDIFEAAGLTTPSEMIEDGTWTWENLILTAKAAVDSGEATWGFWNQAPVFEAGFNTLQEFYNDHGARPWSEDGSTCLLTSSEFIAATQAYHDMIFVDESSPGPSVEVSFANGDVAMSMNRPDFIIPLLDTDISYDVVRMPEGPAGFVPEIGGHALVAFADGPNADIAAEFIISTTAPEAMDNGGGLATPSARLSYLTDERMTELNPVLTQEQVESIFRPSITAETAELVWSHPSIGPMISSLNPIFDGQVWVPDADIPAAMDAACEVIAPFLAVG